MGIAGSIGATPMAILGGSALIAVAVYFGLRSRPVLVAPAASAAPSSSEIAGAAGAAPSIPTASPVLQAPVLLPMQRAAIAAAASNSEGEKDVLAALEQQRPTLVATCWAPVTAKEPQAPPATYVFDLSFDETGHEVARGLSEGSGARPEVTRCLKRSSHVLDIPPHGGRSHVRTRFTLP